MVEGGDFEPALNPTGLLQLLRVSGSSLGPHRRESRAKPNALSAEVAGIAPLVPFEIYKVSIDRRPLTVVGCCLPFFTKIATLLLLVEVIALDSPQSSVNRFWRLIADNAYYLYRTELSLVICVLEQSVKPRRKCS